MCDENERHITSLKMSLKEFGTKTDKLSKKIADLIKSENVCFEIAMASLQSLMIRVIINVAKEEPDIINEFINSLESMRQDIMNTMGINKESDKPSYII